MRVQLDAVMAAYLKNYSKVGIMIHSLTRVSSEIVKIGFEYILEIMKCEGHSSLEGFSSGFKAERNFPVRESTPRTNKCCLMLVLGLNLNLVIP
jgi:hypothetical protein